MSDIQTALKAEICSYGMTPPEQIEPGKIIRFSDNGNKNKNGWCSLYTNSDGTAGAAFGNWKDINRKWFFNPNGKILSQQQQKEFSKQIEQAREQARQEQEKIQATAAKKANEIWRNAGTVDPNHAYLIKKQIKTYGLKQSGKDLLVPVMNFGGAILSLQKISPRGEKKFLPDGKIKGGSVVIGDIQQSKVFYICEGYPKQAVKSFLENRFPETNWDDVIAELPPIIWRHRWNKLAEKTGLPYSKSYLQNLDSEGRGPASFIRTPAA